MDNIFDINRYKKVLIELLRAFDAFCRLNDLNYSLAVGSLLGAIRHGGIIPWDDDIDVIMPRPDYNRFIEMAKDNICNHYRVVHSSTTPNYYLPFAKLIDSRTTLIETERLKACPIGIYLDIYPIDGVPDSDGDCEEKYQKYLELVKKGKLIANEYKLRLFYYSNHRFYLLGETRSFIKHKILQVKGHNSNFYFEEADKIAQSTDFSSAKKFRMYTSVQFHKCLFDKEVFEDYIEVNFEGLKVKAIKNYDTYLKILFNDYMVLPPVEKRKPHHAHYYLDYGKA